MHVEPDRRTTIAPIRQADIESTRGLHWVALLFRALAVLVFTLMLLQIAFGLTSPFDESYGLLFAEAVRMLILSCLLWAVGAISDLFVQSHHDLRASRVLLARIAQRLDANAASASTHGGPDDRA